MILFRLLRLIILLTIAFFVGVLFERKQAKEACEARLGKYFDRVCSEGHDV